MQQLVNLNRLLGETLHIIDAMIPVGACLRLSVDARLPSVEGRSKSVKEAIVQLAGAAADALGGAPGEVEVRTGTCIWNESRGPSARVFVEVEVAGCTKSAAAAPGGYYPIWQLPQEPEMSVAIADSIVRHLGGSLDITTRPGGRIVFRMLLPLVTPSRGQAEEGYRKAS